jgi:predicted nucleic acid-binding protein
MCSAPSTNNGRAALYPFALRVDASTGANRNEETTWSSGRMLAGSLTVAGELTPVELRSVDAIHLATAQQFDAELNHVVTYDDRMAIAARALGIRVTAPT